MFTRGVTATGLGAADEDPRRTRVSVPLIWVCVRLSAVACNVATVNCVRGLAWPYSLEVKETPATALCKQSASHRTAASQSKTLF